MVKNVIKGKLYENLKPYEQWENDNIRLWQHHKENETQIIASEMQLLLAKEVLDQARNSFPLNPKIKSSHLESIAKRLEKGEKLGEMHGFVSSEQELVKWFITNFGSLNPENNPSIIQK